MSRQRPLAPNESQRVHSADAIDGAPARRPYQAPHIVFRQPLEAVAAICSGPGRKSTGLCVVSSS